MSFFSHNVSLRFEILVTNNADFHLNTQGTLVVVFYCYTAYLIAFACAVMSCSRSLDQEVCMMFPKFTTVAIDRH